MAKKKLTKSAAKPPVETKRGGAKKIMQKMYRGGKKDG